MVGNDRIDRKSRKYLTPNGSSSTDGKVSKYDFTILKTKKFFLWNYEVITVG